MKREEAIELLKMYRNWNEGQLSVSLAFKGIRTAEDDVLDARRKMLIEASRVLAQLHTAQ
jgi:hypothetical protein